MASADPLSVFTVVLVRPETAGNVGAAARAMKNFGFSRLLIVDPLCDPFGEEAKVRAKHAIDILRRAKVVPWSHLSRFSTVVGTTALFDSDYNIPRSPLTPREFADAVRRKKTKIALLFGPEGQGLSNEEIRQCDFIVSIPGNDRYRTLNVSHAAAVILYELATTLRGVRTFERFVQATATDKKVLLGFIGETLDAMTFRKPCMRLTQKKVWKRVVGKAMLTKREAFALIGHFKNLIQKGNQKK
ncbi:RNA methyltransferase [Candidatus Woesearchaeota archaeon]|nr:RNA methyltransferase [Candidatus Woesearchaeota archaeon]